MHSGENPSINQQFEMIFKKSDRNDEYIILNRNWNFEIVVLREGCAQFLAFLKLKMTPKIRY